MIRVLALLAACSRAVPVSVDPPRPPVIGPAPRWYPPIWKQPALHCKATRLVLTVDGWVCQ